MSIIKIVVKLYFVLFIHIRVYYFEPNTSIGKYFTTKKKAFFFNLLNNMINALHNNTISLLIFLTFPKNYLYLN